MNEVAAAVPVAIHGVSGGSVGIILTILLSATGTWIVAYFRILPRLYEAITARRKIEIEAGDALREANDVIRKGQIEELMERVAKLERQVEEATRHANAADERTNVMKLKMVSLNAAFQLVAGEMRRTDPDNAILKQALDLIAIAATEDMGFNKAMVELSKLPGTKD